VDLLELIKSRRSIRRYKQDPISDDMLNKILEAAQWAPSWANTQCSRFVVIKDNARKEQIASLLNPTNPSVNAIKEAPVVIAVCGVKGVSGFYKGQAATKKGDWYMFDTAIAAEHICLMAHSLGLGTVHVGLFDEAKANELLNLPENMEVVEFIPVGYPAAESKTPPRKPLSDIVFYERYESK
jgi:nitroreductase